MTSQHSTTPFGLSWAQDRVRAFHEKAGHPIADVPAPLSALRKEKRAGWMQEELDEFLEAESLVDQADAMIDLIYFAMGTLVELGVSGESLFDIVHRANMRKITSSGPILRGDGKVQKPTDWVTPESQMAEAIVAANSRFPLVVATEGDSRSATLAMIAEATGTIGWNRQRFAEDYFTHGLTAGFGEPLFNARAAESAQPFRDDFVSWSHVSEPEFSGLLDDSTVTFPGVIVGFQTGQLYRTQNPTLRYALVVRTIGDRVLVIDPGPQGAGLHVVNVDDLYAGCKSAADGVHRIGLRSIS